MASKKVRMCIELEESTCMKLLAKAGALGLTGEELLEQFCQDLDIDIEPDNNIKKTDKKLFATAWYWYFTSEVEPTFLSYLFTENLYDEAFRNLELMEDGVRIARDFEKCLSTHTLISYSGAIPWEDRETGMTDEELEHFFNKMIACALMQKVEHAKELEGLWKAFQSENCTKNMDYQSELEKLRKWKNSYDRLIEHRNISIPRK